MTPSMMMTTRRKSRVDLLIDFKFAFLFIRYIFSEEEVGACKLDCFEGSHSFLRLTRDSVTEMCLIDRERQSPQRGQNTCLFLLICVSLAVFLLIELAAFLPK